MAATIGDLAVRVGADTVNLEQGFARSSRTVKDFSVSASKQLVGVATNIAKVGAAAISAGAAMTAALYAKQSQVIDSLAKTADALNITTESLQALNHLAELNGVSSESMAKGLRRMEVNLGMAARQGGAAAKALEDVGVNINDLLKLSPDKQIAALSDAIAGVENQSIKASIATDLFGRDGVAMLKVLTQIQKDGLEPTIKKLDEYGYAISRIDAAQVEAANDAFLNAKKVVEGMANTITVKLSPYVQEAADQFVNAASQADGFGLSVEDAIKRSLHFIGFMGDALRGVHVILKGLEVGFQAFNLVVAHVFAGVSGFIDQFINDTNAAINVMITGLNSIPKVDIGLLDTSKGSIAQHMEDELAAVRENFKIAKDEFHALAMEKIPSQAIDEYIENVKNKSLEAAQVVAKEREEILGNTGGGIEAEAEKLKSKEELYAEHMKAMYGITRDGYKGIDKLTNDHWGAATTETVGAMKSVVGTMASGSKKAFEISKAWAIADALVSTFQGIAAGVKLGWPMAIPAVAWAAATGFAQVSAIKNQKFGGAGGAAASGNGAAATAPNPVGVGGATSSGGGASSSSTLTVAPIDPNAIFSGSAMQAFGERIHDFSKDGGKVIFQA